ncbi:MAG: hypothetical protein FWE16_00620 [Firmicutes bacterium]|nr:hypothetical protein [Bacillota bacterium]
MSRRVLAIVIIVFALIAIGMLLFFFIFNNSGASNDLRLTAGRAYYIRAVRGDMFQGDQGGINLIVNDTSHARFDENFRTFTITFANPHNATYTLIVSNFRNNRRGASATLHGIIGGELFIFNMRTTQHHIIFETMITTSVIIEYDRQEEEYTMTRMQSVLEFYITPPEHILPSS